MKYETDEDVKKQDKAGSRMAEHFGMRWQPYHGEFAPADGFLVGSSLQAVVEVKCRPEKCRDYPDYTVDVAKIERLLALAKALEITPFYLLRTPKELLYTDVLGADLIMWERSQQTHTERGTTAEVLHYPWAAFRMLEVAGG